MSNLKNHINLPKIVSNEKNFSDIAKTLYEFHSLYMKNGQDTLSERTMHFYLKSCNHHIYFDEYSLAIVQVVDIEAELITLLVDPNFRNKKIGTKLLGKILQHLTSGNVKKVFLEVSNKNIVALRVYEKVGFQKCGVRKNYYTRNLTTPEDALIMLCYL